MRTSGVRLFAVAAPGLEAVVAGELAALPAAAARDAAVIPGGVEWTGGLAEIYAANLWSRVATRVYLRVGEVKAADFARLRRGVAGLPWEHWIAPGAAVEVTAAARKCRLYHTGGIAERVAAGIADRLSGPGSDVGGRKSGGGGRKSGGGGRKSGGGVGVEVLARGEHDVFTLSIDTSGELLHKRGYRGEQREAPLRETLAAGMLMLAGWDPATPLLDPMCGSGTIAIEAALLASGRAPGIARRFAFEAWPSHDAALWTRTRATAATSDPRPHPHPHPHPSTSTRTSTDPNPRPGTRLDPSEREPLIFASDRDPAALAIARRNAERAGIADLIAFEHASVHELSGNRTPRGMNVHSALTAPRPAGLVITNPPYGKRISTRRAGGAVSGDLRALWRSLPGWSLAVLTPDRAFPGTIGARPLASHSLVNGGIRVTFFVFGPG